MHKNLYNQDKFHIRAKPPPSPLERSCIGFMEFVIISPDIFFPSLEITAEIAHPEGMRT